MINIHLQLIIPLSSQQNHNSLPQPVEIQLYIYNPNAFWLLPVDDGGLRDEDVQVTLLLSFVVHHMPQCSHTAAGASNKDERPAGYDTRTELITQKAC